MDLKIKILKDKTCVIYLLESGVDLNYIQKILGHKSSKTNEVYAYISRKDLASFISPLDRFNLNQQKEVKI